MARATMPDFKYLQELEALLSSSQEHLHILCDLLKRLADARACGEDIHSLYSEISQHIHRILAQQENMRMCISSYRAHLEAQEAFCQEEDMRCKREAARLEEELRLRLNAVRKEEEEMRLRLNAVHQEEDEIRLRVEIVRQEEERLCLRVAAARQEEEQIHLRMEAARWEENEIRRRVEAVRRKEEMHLKEEAARREEEMRLSEEAARREEEMRLSEEAARREEEMRLREEAARREKEMRLKEEAARREEEMHRELSASCERAKPASRKPGRSVLDKTKAPDSGKKTSESDKGASVSPNAASPTHSTGTEKDTVANPAGPTGLLARLFSRKSGKTTSAAPSEACKTAAAPKMSAVEFSAIAPKRIEKNSYSMIDVVMYEGTFRHIVDDIIAQADAPVNEKRSGVLNAAIGSRITVRLSSPDMPIEDDTIEQVWSGSYLNFSFAVMLPEDYTKKQVLFIATVYFDGVIATRLKFTAQCISDRRQNLSAVREDVMSAFISYASQDRHHVATILQGMQKIRPDLDIFFDVDSLRSGEDWEHALWKEISSRDILYLCWSRNARDSKWVEAEWRYALNQKGLSGIEPVPIEPPSLCPPPEELRSKHFNDKLLYIINAPTDAKS